MTVRKSIWFPGSLDHDVKRIVCVLVWPLSFLTFYCSFSISGRWKAGIKGKFLIPLKFYILVTNYQRITILRFQPVCIACPQRVMVIPPHIIRCDVYCRSDWQEGKEETNHLPFQHAWWHTCWDHLSKLIILYRPQDPILFSSAGFSCSRKEFYLYKVAGLSTQIIGWNLADVTCTIPMRLNGLLILPSVKHYESQTWCA